MCPPMTNDWQFPIDQTGTSFMPKILKIKLKKSLIGRPEKHRRVVQSLGLRKLNKTVVLADTPTIRGMVQKVSHLLDVEEQANETT